MHTLRGLLSVVAVAISLLTISGKSSLTRAETLFFDDFNSGASPAWSNSVGNWVASGGVYRAQNPSNDPNSYSFVSTLPSLTDFTVTVDINSARDGGIWLRARSDTGTVGVTGVLLIFLNDALHPNVLFWHEVGQFNAGSNAYGPELNTAANLPLGNFSLRIVVEGDMYSAFVNGSTTPATTLITDRFTSGFTGVYDHDVFNGAQSFDNFRVFETPLPATLPLFATGLGALGLLGWYRKRKAAAVSAIRKTH